MQPAPANAGLGISFDLVSVGPFSVGIDIPVSGALPLLGAVAVGAVVVAFFKGIGSLFRASYGGGGGSGISQRISVNPDDRVAGRPLTIRLSQYDWFEEGKIPLPSGGHLSIEADGKMVFEGSEFEGYAYLYYDDTFTVWDPDDKPVVVIKPEWRAAERAEPATLLLVEESERGRRVVELLFGREIRK